ncbi:MAG: tetratricopeptide repeat protein, partial [Actinomycetota bacterium]|nr:tetratricopeptide repeat protein [Actinomycetota bacterium]
AYSQLRLDSLPAESAAELLAALLGPDPGLVPLTQMLVKRGNPFFLEETVRTLVETGALAGERGAYRLTRPVEALQVPATVQTILAARIDRLPAEEKQLLQAAAVIGKAVPHALLAAIASLPEEDFRRGLGHLQAAEFLYETQLFPDLEFTFKHALTHEVTYGGLLQERRRALHARVVQAIETLYRDRLGDQIERLAHHAVRGELREQAVLYLRQAGLRAAARSALPDARAWFEQALDVLASLPESPSTLEQAFEIRLELRPVLNQLGEVRRALERLREAEVLAETLNDDHRRGRVCALMTNVHSLLGELEEACASGTRALEIAGRLGDLRLSISATTYLEQVHYYRGDYERVVELATDNLAALPADCVYEYFGLTAPASVFNRFWLVMSLAELGRFAAAAEYSAEAIRLAEPMHHPFTVGQTHRAAGTLHLLKGDWAKARPLIEHGIAAFRTGNVVLQLSTAVAASAWVLAQLDEASEALNRLREGEQLFVRQEAQGIVGYRGWMGRALGRTCLLLGRLDEAQRLGDRVVESLPSELGSTAHALLLLGDIATHPDRFDAERGEAHYHQALALAEPRGMRPLVAHCHLGFGTLYATTGRLEQAHEHLTTAMAMYREMGMTFWLEKAEADMKSLG